MTQTEFTQRVLAMQDRLYRVSCTLLRCEADREDAVQSHCRRVVCCTPENPRALPAAAGAVHGDVADAHPHQ